MKRREISYHQRPWAIAHRGDSSTCPENTNAAFRAALAAKVDAIELDVRLSRDGVPFVCHDAHGARFGGTRKSFRTMTIHDIQSMDIGSWKNKRFRHERLMTLQDVLALTQKITVCIELKATAGRGSAAYHRRLVAAVISTIQQSRAQSRVMLLCFNASVLHLCAQLAPAIPRVRNCERLPRNHALWMKQQSQCTSVCFDRRLVSPDLVSLAHHHGLKVFSYSANNASVARHLIRCQVDGILSDKPGWLVPYLRSL